MTSALIAGIVALVVALIGGAISWLTNRKTLDQERKSNDAKLDHERDTLRQTLEQERQLNDAKLNHERDTLTGSR